MLRSQRWSFAVIFFVVVLTAAITASPQTSSQPHGIRIDGPGSPPQLFFTCCDKGISAAEALFAKPGVIPDLKNLHAGIAVAIPDFSPERAGLVRRLDDAGIPLIAWIELQPERGTYLNSGDFPAAQAAFSRLGPWSAENGLRWRGVGLDIEPNFSELAQLRGHRWRLMCLLVSRYCDRARVLRARADYGRLIHQLQARGWLVQTYQLPFMAAEREEHSTLLERLLGVVDVRGDQEALMLYTSYVPEVGAGMIRTLGPYAQAIAVGSTEATPGAGLRGEPLNWESFSQDLIVAAHFSPTVGVYSLEGCVQQGFLDRLQSMDWHQTVEIAAQQVRRGDRMTRAIRAGIWVGTWLPLLVILGVLWAVALIAYWRVRRRLVRLRLESPQ